jgi:hypothetical protein
MSEAAVSWWTSAAGEGLMQGDYLPHCLVPLFQPDFGRQTTAVASVAVEERDCVVLTQSCDLENDKAVLVALCPVFLLPDFEAVNQPFAQKGVWERVRQGRVEGLHLLASPTEPGNNRASFVADFRQIYSLPVGYLRRHADSLGPRWRLRSPFLEHLSQAFARFFMRVGLPSAIPAFKS